MLQPLTAALLLTTLLLAGCGAPQVSDEERTRLEAPARALEARGAWREAALAWQQAADAQGDTELATTFRLNAADALLRAGDATGAMTVAGGLPAELPPDQSLRRALVLADAGLLAGDPVDALRRLGPAVTSTDSTLLARYRRIRADALEVTGDLVGAARERALRDMLLFEPEAVYRNRQRIWRLLERVPPEVLAGQPIAPPQTTSGWVELAMIARRYVLDVEALEAAIREWDARYPGHPAGEQIVPEVVERVRAEAQPPTKVALLLPQSGPFASAGSAVRDGFVAAWLADAPNPQRPELLVRDSAEGDIALTYASVLAEGAQFVVGPLAKDSVNALLSDAELSVTTLMLNYPSLSPAQNAAAAAARAGEPAPGADRAAAVGDAPPAPTPAADQTSLPPPGAAPGVAADGALAAPLPAATTPRLDLIRAHHFALAPEDEAIGAAEFAFARGARQAAVLTPEGAWGERVREAFTARWESLGGVVAASRAYPEEATGLSAAVAALLNVDQSKQRARRLRAVLVRDIKHEPTPRSDLDVVFMAAFPQTARQLKPLLLFHRADTIPVITTSHAYSATRDPALDQDIEGVVFGDMPWVLSPDSHPLPGQARRHWPSADGATGRLYAFGADAYTLVSRLRDLRRGARYPGLTGELHLTQDRHVERVLEWARIENGLPVTLDPYTAGELYWTPALP